MPNPFTEHIQNKTFSVTEYLELVNELLGPLNVSVEGEITDLKILPQWVFFSLKDAESSSVLRCGLHSGVYRRLGVNIEEGMTVKIEGYGKLAPKTGNFGFWVSKIEPIGEGALKKAYELLVKKLDKEGFFARKRALPEFITHIGVVSSRNGVVLQDLMKNIKPLGIRVDFVHAGVEGADSSIEIEKAIHYFSKTKDRPQVLVLIRGGGSMESLQGFNNENVARSIFGAPMPVLVGIGHDTDAPIATMVADWSASTPTAVAHVINDSWEPLLERVPVLSHSITETFSKRVREVEHSAENTFLSIKHAVKRVITHFESYKEAVLRAKRHVARNILRNKQKVEDNTIKVFERMKGEIHTTEKNIYDYERLLAMSDPKRILSRGYGLVYNMSGILVRSVEHVKEGETLKTVLSDGTVLSRVIKKK